MAILFEAVLSTELYYVKIEFNFTNFTLTLPVKKFYTKRCKKVDEKKHINKAD